MDVTILDWMRIQMDTMLNSTMDPHGLSTCFYTSYTVLRKFECETACAPPGFTFFEQFGAVKVAAIVSKKSSQCLRFHVCNVLHLKPLKLGRQVSCFTFRPNQAIELKAHNSTTSMHALHCKDLGVNNPIQATRPNNKRIANLAAYVCPFTCAQLVAVASFDVISNQ